MKNINESYMAIDGTICSNKSQVEEINNAFWDNNIISNGILNPIEKETIKQHFKSELSKIEDETITTFEFSQIYCSFIEAMSIGIISEKLQRLFLVALFDAKTKTPTEEELDALIAIKDNLFTLAADLDNTTVKR